MDESEKRYLKTLGSRILSEANDLKRTPEALAQELAVPIQTVASVLAGEAPTAVAEELVSRMAHSYPIARADILVERDDTVEGVRVMRASESAATSRVFSRRDAAGGTSPYYEYRDTAMSRNAPFKPEWIRPLRVVRDASADNPDVAFNHGHLLHQQTFFLGAVNFYWRKGERAFCREMHLGDSNYITPFVPHSFTSRDAARLGLIVAVTYAGQVRRALSDFARVGNVAADELAGDLRETAGAYRACLERHMSAESLDPFTLSLRLAEENLPVRRREDLSNGAVPQNEREYQALARALRVRPKDLVVETLSADEEVVLLHRRDDARPFGDAASPAYLLRELARSRHQPGLKGFDIDVRQVAGASNVEKANLHHGLHEYVYNYGSHPVRIEWRGRGETLEPGDSAYIQPLVTHRFVRGSTSIEARLAAVRVSGTLNDAVFEEYAAFDAHGRSRVAEETRRWF